MLVFCEECGKRYSFPPEKTEPGSNIFRCRECKFLMTVNVAPDPKDSADKIRSSKAAEENSG